MTDIHIQIDGDNNSSPKPVFQLKTNRSLIKCILLGIITLGIYPLVLFANVSSDINIIASRYDGKKTMNYLLLLFIIGPLTLGIAYFVWNHRICDRIGMELRRRNLPYEISCGTFWLWEILGIIIVIGPLVYTHKLLKAMNYLSADYNQHG